MHNLSSNACRVSPSGLNTFFPEESSRRFVYGVLGAIMVNCLGFAEPWLSCLALPRPSPRRPAMRRPAPLRHVWVLDSTGIETKNPDILWCIRRAPLFFVFVNAHGRIILEIYVLFCLFRKQIGKHVFNTICQHRIEVEVEVRRWSHGVIETLGQNRKRWWMVQDNNDVFLVLIIQLCLNCCIFPGE